MRRFALAAVGLFAIYLVLSFGNDAHGYLGTDTGGKVATLRAMEDDNDPDVGYWAEQWDPQGQVHPLYYTSHIGERWVNVTTLPAIYAASPLYNAFGYRGALVVPMLGAVACALAAAALIRRLTPDSDGWLAFWIVGLASPVLIYALDFWEHTLGLALMAWAVVLLVDIEQRTRSMWWGIGAGALFGAAATMRTEAFVYAFIATGLTCLLLVRRKWVTAVGVGALVVAGLVVPVVANGLFERAVLGESMRSARAAGTVSSADEVRSTDRAREAAVTTLGSTSDGDAASLLIGAAIVGAVVVAVLRRDERALILAAALLAARTVRGLDFVPGFLVAAPLGAAGLALGWRRGPPTRTVVAVAILALPLVWVFQFAGGAGPQWGGRYVLLTSFLLGIAGIAALLGESARLRRSVLAMAGVVTALGLAWMFVRTDAIAEAEQRLAARREPVLISRVAHLVREGGGVLDLDRWLTAVTPADLRKAASVAAAAGADRIAVVDLSDHLRPDTVGNYQYRGDSNRVEFLPGIDLVVSVYQRG